MHISKLQIRSFFQIKVVDSFLISSWKYCCRHSLEAPCRGASNEYPQHIFSWRNKKNIFLISWYDIFTGFTFVWDRTSCSFEVAKRNFIDSLYTKRFLKERYRCKKIGMKAVVSVCDIWNSYGVICVLNNDIRKCRNKFLWTRNGRHNSETKHLFKGEYIKCILIVSSLRFCFFCFCFCFFKRDQQGEITLLATAANLWLLSVYG